VREQKRERFKELCEHAEVVDDPEKLSRSPHKLVGFSNPKWTN